MASGSNSYYYLIGDCIEFRPEDNLLHSRLNGEKITLFVAASRCLQLLLNQQGKLVSQKDLIEAGWQKNGMGVSSNTFYQNILILRKGFKLAGYEQTVIKTVPRQGLTIPSAVHVGKITPGKEREHSKVESVTEEKKPSTPCHVTKKTCHRVCGHRCLVSPYVQVLLCLSYGSVRERATSFPDLTI